MPRDKDERIEDWVRFVRLSILHCQCFDWLLGFSWLPDSTVWNLPASFSINENCSLAKSNGLCPRSNKIWSLSFLAFHWIRRWNRLKKRRRKKKGVRTEEIAKLHALHTTQTADSTGRSGEKLRTEIVCKTVTTCYLYVFCVSSSCFRKPCLRLIPPNLCSFISWKSAKRLLCAQTMIQAYNLWSCCSCCKEKVLSKFAINWSHTVSKEKPKGAKSAKVLKSKKMSWTTPSDHMSWAVWEQHRKTVMSSVALLFLRKHKKA